MQHGIVSHGKYITDEQALYPDISSVCYNNHDDCQVQLISSPSKTRFLSCILWCLHGKFLPVLVWRTRKKYPCFYMWSHYYMYSSNICARAWPVHCLFWWTSKICLVKHWSHPKRSKKFPILIMNSDLMTWHHYQHCQSVTLLPPVSRSHLLKEFTLFIVQFPAHMIIRRSQFRTITIKSMYTSLVSNCRFSATRS